MTPHLLRRAVVFGAYLLALLAVAEMGVRWSGFASRHVPDRIYRYVDADIPYAHKPNLRGVRGWNDTRFDTDALGLRSRVGGEPYARTTAGEYRIALIGDSVTFGEGVATPDIFAERLADALQASGIRVFNFGVSGYSVRQMAATVARRVAAVEPDLVLIVLIPADFELSRTGTLDAWGSVRPSGPSGRLEWMKPLLRRLHLAYALVDLARGRQAKWSSVPITSVPPSYAYVAGLRDSCRAQHLTCGVVLLSTKIDDGFGPITARVRAEGLPWLDLTGIKDAFTVEQFSPNPYDPHPSAAVHQRIAELLAPWIRLLKNGHLRRCSVDSLVRRSSATPPRSLPRASHLTLFEQPDPGLVRSEEGRSLRSALND